MTEAKAPRRGMFALIVAWAMIGFGALSALLSFVEAPNEARAPQPCVSVVAGDAPATCEPVPAVDDDGNQVARRVIGGAILVAFGALLLFARHAFIPLE